MLRRFGSADDVTSPPAARPLPQSTARTMRRASFSSVRSFAAELEKTPAAPTAAQHFSWRSRVACTAVLPLVLLALVAMALGGPAFFRAAHSINGSALPQEGGDHSGGDPGDLLVHFKQAVIDKVGLSWGGADSDQEGTDAADTVSDPGAASTSESAAPASADDGFFQDDAASQGHAPDENISDSAAAGAANSADVVVVPPANEMPQPSAGKEEPMSGWLHDALYGHDDKPVDWAVCLADETASQPFTVTDFLAARPARLPSALHPIIIFPFVCAGVGYCGWNYNCRLAVCMIAWS